jgi:hypothetical protein
MVVPKSECYSFVVHEARGRWILVFVLFLIMATSGVTYLFSIYSNDIKRNRGYSQLMLNTLSTWNDIGSSVGILSGLVAKVTPSMVTPTRFMLGVTSVTNFLGYLIIWLAIIGNTHKPEFWLMCVYMFIGANGQNFATIASVLTFVKVISDLAGLYVLKFMKPFMGIIQRP